MIDTAINKPLKVVPNIGVWPFLDVTVNHLPALKQVLDSHGLRYWVRENSISFNGGPYITQVHFYRGADPEAIQKLLDSVN